MAIEDKRITKGIVRAQKKVEERNFLARKNLLEYDEVMDHQRTTFYGMRQQVLEGRDDRPGHLGHDRRVDRGRGATSTSPRTTSPTCIAEWARTNFEVDHRAGGPPRAAQDRETWRNYIKSQGRRPRPRRTSRSTLGEFMGEDAGEPGRLGHQGPVELGDEPLPVELSPRTRSARWTPQRAGGDAARGRHRADRQARLLAAGASTSSRCTPSGSCATGRREVRHRGQARGDCWPMPSAACASRRGHRRS